MILEATIVASLAVMFGMMSRRWVPSGRVHGALLATALMYVTVRSLAAYLSGARPTSAVLALLVLIGVGSALGAQRVSLRFYVGSAAAVAFLLINFRSGWEGPLATSAITLALPATLLGLSSSGLSERSMRVVLFAWSCILAGLLLATGVVAAGRLEIPEENPIWIGRGLALGGLALLFSSRSVLLRWSGLLVAVALIVQTGSRGPLWGLIIGILIYLVGRSSAKYRGGLIFAVGVISCGILLFGANLEQLAQLGIERQSSTSSRLSLWSEALEAWKDAPLFGTGFAIDQRAGTLGQYPHNFIVELLLQGGLVAVAAAGLAIGFAIYRARSAFLRAIVGFSVAVALVSGSVWVNLELWAIVAVCLVHRGIVVDETKAPKSSPVERSMSGGIGESAPGRGLLRARR